MLKNLILVVFSIVFSILLMEVGVRVFSWVAFPKMMEIDSILGWRHAADREKTFVNEDGDEVLVINNRFGNRGPAYSGPVKAGARRVLVLGDSFTEGVQVGEHELYTALIDNRHDDLEVINTGVGSWGTVQQFLYLEQDGLAFDPDVVLQAYYANDLTENCLTHSPGMGARPYARLDQEGRVQIQRELDASEFREFSLPVPFLLTVNEYSYLYGFLNTRIYQRIFHAELRERSLAERARIPECRPYEVLFALIDLVSETLREKGIGYKLVLFPSLEEAEAGSSETHVRILQHCQRTGLECHSLLPPLAASVARGERPYFDEDIHWTRVGHAIAADAISPILASETRAARQAAGPGAQGPQRTN